MHANQALSVFLPALYAIIALAYFPAATSGKSGPLVRSRATLLAVTLVLHVVLFVLRGLEIAQFPINDLGTTVSAVALSTAAFWMLVARQTGHTGSGALVLALVTLAQLAASGFGEIAPHARPQGMGAVQIAHVATSTIAAAALVLSGVHGCLYLLLLHEMRERRFGALFGNLPDLDLLARMTRRSALFGFIGLAVGLNVGIGLAHAENSPGFNYRNPEVLVSLLLWVYFGVIAFSQNIPGFGARRASWAAIGGLVVLILSTLLVLLPGSFHSHL